MPEQRGNVLLLVPAGVLVLVIFGALAVDAALAFLGQRALTDAAAAAANDAAAAASSPSARPGSARRTEPSGSIHTRSGPTPPCTLPHACNSATDWATAAATTTAWRPDSGGRWSRRGIGTHSIT